MLKQYEKRARRLIANNSQWIQGEIKNDANKDTYNKAFDEFVEKLQCGENLLNAKRDIQKKYGIQIEFDTIFTSDIHEKSTLIVRVG